LNGPTRRSTPELSEKGGLKNPRKEKAHEKKKKEKRGGGVKPSQNATRPFNLSFARGATTKIKFLSLKESRVLPKKEVWED